MDDSSNHVIWKAKISCLLDEYDLKAYISNVVAVSTDPGQLKAYKKEMAKAKRLILDGFRDHVVSHIAGKDIGKQLWDALATLYQGSFEQRKMYWRRSWGVPGCRMGSV